MRKTNKIMKFKKYTIEDLRNGKVVIDFKKEPDVTLLNKIINLAFGGSNCYMYDGIKKYYGRVYLGDYVFSTDDTRNLSTNNTCKLSEIEVPQEILKLNETILLLGIPYEVVNYSKDYFFLNNTGDGTNNQIFDRLGIEDQFEYQHGILGYIRGNRSQYSFPECKSLEDLTTLVEALKNYKMKEIIGYRAPFNLFEGKVIRGTIYKIVNDEAIPQNVQLTADRFKLPKEIVETWEPVYKEELKEKEFELCCDEGLFFLTVTKDGFYYKPDRKYLNPHKIEELIEPKKMVHRDYNFETIVEKVNLGCKKNVHVNYLKKMLAYYNENFKPENK